MVWVKICGVTTVADAVAVADAGADAIGLNFADSSLRRIELSRAHELVRAVGRRVEWVGVFVDAPGEFIEKVRAELELDWIQLHGSETVATVASHGSRAFKALRIGDAADVSRAAAYPGSRLLVDAKVPGTHGGTGQTFDWSLLAPILPTREVILAGGLGPANVERAVREVRPFGVDTASGVEREPGLKDHELVRAFVTAARAGAAP